ncbi:acetyltransferase-like isoleucine patch superfamily enzyme [Methylobacterium sp. BE186]|uniref:acyltransferase n=1 Tax=Methylobacterium sp. BE186 TaxID=2817715 RepID=UPI00285AEDFB|nr:acyltransferase [Methylobacterium sp. BE186]MDR7038327.1 acetyltransferase-like isoleucine patch superfamily enzyme [Methylobacterium sp. BE186]
MPYISERMMAAPTSWGGWEKVHIGKSVSMVNTLCNASCGDIYIGDFTFFGHNVSLLTGTHQISEYGEARQKAVPGSGRDIHIGTGVWVASNATVIGPCRIGDNAVIGVGSVVIGDVKAGWFYAGVPARPIKPVGPEYSSDNHQGTRRSISSRLREMLLNFAERL